MFAATASDIRPGSHGGSLSGTASYSVVSFCQSREWRAKMSGYAEARITAVKSRVGCFVEGVDYRTWASS